MLILPVDELLTFSKKYNIFNVKKRNNKIKEILSFDKKIFLALFYEKEIACCQTHKSVLDFQNELVKFAKSWEEKNFYKSQSVFSGLKIEETTVVKLSELIDIKTELEKAMNSTQSSLSRFLKQRTEFLVLYEKSIVESSNDENVCPLCGRYSDDLKRLFVETETAFKSNLGSIAKQLTDVINELSNIYVLFFLSKINDFYNRYKNIIELNNMFKPYINLTTKELKAKLDKKNIEFVCKTDVIDFNKFENEYSELVKKLTSNIKIETEVISDEMYSKLLRIHLKYYVDTIPYDELTLQKKKFYISSMFSNSFSKKLNELSVNFNSLDYLIKEKEKRYISTMGNLSALVKKYEAAKKEYQSSIAKNIAVPLFVFSGKIIQNYPLGLGIIISVENNAVVFKTGNMRNDIFNNLSTGQLNGVIISLLLSIKEVFFSEKSLNIMLIDDPLQTIDEISAISLIDLLSEHFGDTQIILSTHEDDKQFLMKKKYEQSEKNVKLLICKRSIYKSKTFTFLFFRNPQ